MKTCIPLPTQKYLMTGLFACLLLRGSGMIAQEIRPVPVPVQPIDSITLYLTFDDGIIPASEALQELAGKEELPLTVFWIGQFVLQSDTTRRIWQQLRSNAWIESGNHSYSHANGRYYKYYRDPQQVLIDFWKNQDSLQLTTKLARLPGRNAWRIAGRKRDDLDDCKVVADSLALAGYTLFGWDIEWNYSAAGYQLEPAGDLLFRIGQAIRFHRTFTRRQVVILCHDPALNNPLSIAALQAFTRQARQQGYRFRLLTQYPATGAMSNSPDNNQARQ